MLTKWMSLPVRDWRDMLQERIFRNTLEMEECSIQ